LLDHGIGLGKRLAERGIQRVYRTVSFRGFEMFRAPGRDFDIGDRTRDALADIFSPDGNVLDLEKWFEFSEKLLHQEFKARFRSLELITFMLKPLDLSQDLFGFRRILLKMHLQFLGLDHDVRLAAKLGHEVAPVIADGLGLHMLIGLGVLYHGVDVNTAFMCESRPSRERLIVHKRHIANLGHIMRQRCQFLQFCRRKTLKSHFELQIRNDTHKIRIAAAFPITIDRPLHERAAFPHGLHGICDSKLGVIMAMDPERCLDRAFDSQDRVSNLMRQCPAVGVAKCEIVGAGFRGLLQGFKRVFRIRLEPVKEMLRVIDHFDLSILQKRDGLIDHEQVFFECGLEYFRNMHIP